MAGLGGAIYGAENGQLHACRASAFSSLCYLSAPAPHLFILFVLRPHLPGLKAYTRLFAQGLFLVGLWGPHGELGMEPWSAVNKTVFYFLYYTFYTLTLLHICFENAYPWPFLQSGTTCLAQYLLFCLLILRGTLARPSAGQAPPLGTWWLILPGFLLCSLMPVPTGTGDCRSVLIQLFWVNGYVDVILTALLWCLLSCSVLRYLVLYLVWRELR